MLIRRAHYSDESIRYKALKRFIESDLSKKKSLEIEAALILREIMDGESMNELSHADIKRMKAANRAFKKTLAWLLKNSGGKRFIRAKNKKEFLNKIYNRRFARLLDRAKAILNTPRVSNSERSNPACFIQILKKLIPTSDGKEAKDSYNKKENQNLFNYFRDLYHEDYTIRQRKHCL